MKKKFLLLAATLSALIVLMTSCLVVTPPDNDDDIPDPEEFAYTAIVKGDEFTTSSVKTLVDSIKESHGVTLPVVGSSGTTLGGEIIIGNAQRPLAGVALSAVQAAENKFTPSEDADRFVGYAIRSDGVNVALYCSDDLLFADALKALSDLIKTYGVIPADVTAGESYSSLAYKRAREAKATEEMYAAIEAELGHDTVIALQQLYGIYDDRLYKWMAELYDPGVQNPDGSYAGGGFYYSNSARGAQGFLPDMESTCQLFGFFSGTGMLYEYGDSVFVAFPEWMRKQIIAFARNCQSPTDGYFYHPQWGMNVSETRKGRDLMWGANLLGTLDAKPYWDTPRGDKGLYGAPGSEMTASLGTRSSVSAVASVVAAESKNHLPAYLQSEAAFLAKMNSYPWPSTTDINNRNGSSYSGVGGEIDAIADQVIAAGYGPKMIEFLAEKQEAYQQLRRDNGLEPNGLWDAVTCYDGVNGLMKICAVYERMKMGINYAEAAFASVVEIIVLEGKDADDVEPNAVITVYNPWITLNRLIDSIEAAGDQEKGAELRQLVRDDAVRMINVSRDKIVKFKQDDGSYGMRYATEAVNSSLYGTTVAVPGTVEGEVNGAILATNSLTREISEGLGIELIIGRDKVPMYNDSDFDVMMAIIEDMTPIIKDPIVFENEIYDFEGEDLDSDGASASGITSTRFDSSVVKIVEDPKDRDNKAFYIVKSKGTQGDKFAINVQNNLPGANCRVFEFRFMANSMSGNLQCRIGSCYNLLLRGQNDGIALGEMTSNGSDGKTYLFGNKLSYGEWHDIRVEYYIDDPAVAVTKVYVDDELVAVSTNYVNSHLGNVRGEAFSQVLFYMDSGTLLEGYFDNIKGEFAELPFSMAPEAPEEFTDGGDYVSSGANTAVVTDPEDRDNLVLNIAAGESVTLKSAVAALHCNVASVKLNLYVPSCNVGEIGRIWLGGEKEARALTAYALVADGRSFSIHQVTKKDGVLEDAIIEGLSFGEWIELEIEHYIYQFDEEYTYCRGIVTAGGETVYTEVCYFADNLSLDYTNVGFASTQEFYIDDILAMNTEKTYVDEDGKEIPDPKNPFPSIAPDQTNEADPGYTGMQDFDDMELGIGIPDGFFTMLNNEPGNTLEVVADPDDEDNKMLMLRTEPAETGGNTIGIQYAQGAGNTYVFEASFKISQMTEMAAGFLQLSVRPDKGSNYGIFAVCFKKVGDTASLYEFNGSATGSQIYAGIGIDEWVTVRIEMPLDEDKAVVTVIHGDNTEEFTSTSFWTDKVPAGTDVKTQTPQYFRIFSPRVMDNLIYIDDVKAYTE